MKPTPVSPAPALCLLTSDQAAQADRLTVAAGAFSIVDLMLRAGDAAADLALSSFPGARTLHVLCGPGNNGGDGYAAAAALRRAGAPVIVYAGTPPKAGSDAAKAAALWGGPVGPLDTFAASDGDLVIDALFGAGLSRAVDGAEAAAIDRANASGAAILAVDLPSGVSGDSGRALGTAIRADATVTFFARKPAHLLQPGRGHCGAVSVAEIGISDGVLDEIGPTIVENQPALWIDAFPRPAVDTHKYRRGHACVLSGGPASSGAARLSALGAARAGAGAVTLLSPPDALLVNAAHLTSIMLRRAGSIEDVLAFVDERKPAALLAGPGFGTSDAHGEMLLGLMQRPGDGIAAFVLDADALTLMSRRRPTFLALRSASGAAPMILTPHEGEFARLFPDIEAGEALSKVERARRAAKLANAVVILKGPDTVIAAPDGRAAINANGTPWLATAGSGDVLAGLSAGLLAQHMPAFEAACAAVWLHAEAGAAFGPGLIAEDLPDMLPGVLRLVMEMAGKP